MSVPLIDSELTEIKLLNGIVFADEGAVSPRLMGPNQPLLFLPPPPDHPPPSDIGTPPDSPTALRYNPERGLGAHPIQHQSPHTVYSDNGAYTPRTHRGVHHAYNNHNHHNYQDPNNRCRTMSPRGGDQRNSGVSSRDSRAYSPRAMSEPERGPTPPVRAYKLVPIRDNHHHNELHRHYSDTEGAPAPPLRMLVPHTPPSPAPDDPMMDRGIQSSLPSLINEPQLRGYEIPSEGHPLLGGDGLYPHQGGDSEMELEGLQDYPCESDIEAGHHLMANGHGRAHSPESSIADVDTVTGKCKSCD